MRSGREKIFVSLGESEAYLDLEEYTLEINIGFQPFLKCSIDSEIFDGFLEVIEDVGKHQLPYYGTTLSTRNAGFGNWCLPCNKS